jgi:hypothetical protein
LVKKYIPQETAKAIANLYEQTGDKTVLAIIEEFEVGKMLIQKLEDEIRSLQKTLVVLYVSRNSSTEENEGKVRQLPAQLETKEIDIFEQVFSDLQPSKKDDIVAIRKQKPHLITPFMYGLTAFGRDFKKIDDYIKYTLDCAKKADIKVYYFLGFVALIARYTQVPIPESLFYNYLGIDTDLNLENTSYYETLELFIIFTYNSDSKERFLKMRNSFFTEEISEIVISGGNPDNRYMWKKNIKSWVLELIDIINKAYPDEELYSIYKKLINSLFLEKESVLTEDDEKSDFSRLITELIKYTSFSDAIEVLKKLADTFNKYADDAFYSQHLARLYYEYARQGQGTDIETKISLFDNAIKYATDAIELYKKNTYKSSILYHTLGHAALLKLDFINKNFQTFQAFEGIEELYALSSKALDECIKLEETDTYGYQSYARLVVTTLDFGRKKSGYDSFDKFFQDERYDWYVDKIDIGIELVTKSLNFWSKHSSHAKDDYQELENKRKTSTKQKFQESIDRYYAELLKYSSKHSGSPLNMGDYNSRIRNAKSESVRNFWQNAKIDFILQKKDFSNPQKGLEKMVLSELNEIIPLLKSSLEYRPTLRDFKRWLKSVRNDIYPIDLETARNFIEYLNTILVRDNQNLLLHTEVSYYLYCLQAIQIINLGQSMDKEPERKMQQSLNLCKKNAGILYLKRSLSFEWLGLNKNDGLEQLVSKEKLGVISASQYDFFGDTTLLREITGTITSVSNQSGSTRQTGGIQLDNCGLEAFFVPIYGGFIQNNDGVERCKFDNTNNLNARVKFFIGFSYDGLRAWQPIPIDAVRAIPNKKESAISSKGDMQIDAVSKFKVKNIDKPNRQIEGYIIGMEKQTIHIPFDKERDYEYYKHWRGQIIDVELSLDKKYKIKSNN